jgi:hypothetical protein
LTARWHYRDILLEVQAALTHDGRRHAVPMSGSESLDHAMYKVSIAAHLLAWGYGWEQIHWEESPPQGPSGFRPDLYAEGRGNLPFFWFECGGTEQEKLSAVVASVPEFRVVRVTDCDWFTRLWSGEDSYIVADKIVRLDKITDWKERRQLILQGRKRVIPPGAECWALRGRENAPRIIFAVRRELDGRFTYLDSGEGWSLSSLRYVFNRSTGFQPLIPGVVGSKKWQGRSQAYYRKEESHE